MVPFLVFIWNKLWPQNDPQYCPKVCSNIVNSFLLLLILEVFGYILEGLWSPTTAQNLSVFWGFCKCNFLGLWSFWCPSWAHLGVFLSRSGPNVQNYPKSCPTSVQHWSNKDRTNTKTWPIFAPKMGSTIVQDGDDCALQFWVDVSKTLLVPRCPQNCPKRPQLSNPKITPIWPWNNPKMVLRWPKMAPQLAKTLTIIPQDTHKWFVDSPESIW